jgi:hypothetical protein
LDARFTFTCRKFELALAGETTTGWNSGHRHLGTDNKLEWVQVGSLNVRTWSYSILSTWWRWIVRTMKSRSTVIGW